MNINNLHVPSHYMYCNIEYIPYFICFMSIVHVQGYKDQNKLYCIVL